MSGRTSSSSDNKQALSELTEWKGELTDFSDVQYGKRSSAEAVSTVPLAGAWGERYSPQKRILLVKNVVCLVSCSAALPFAIFAAGDGGSREYVITAALGVAILTTIASLCRLLPSDESAFDNALYEMWWVECQFYVYAMCLGAIELADPRTSVWPFFLLQIETAFLMPMPARTVKVLFLVVVSVLVVKHANEIFDFDRNGIENSAISVELSLLMLGLELVFLCCGTVIAYHAQRELIKRTATLTHTISSVHTTARCIKKFDLDAADTLLNMDSELPLETHVSLREIIDSLRAYQPFIPAMCLPRPSDVEDVVIHAPKIPPHEEEEIKLGWSLSDRDFLGGSPLLHYDVQSVVSPPARSVRRSRVSINTATTSETTASTLFSPSASSKGAKTVHSPLRASVCSSRGMLPVPSKGNSLMKWQLAAAAARKNYLHLSHGNITVLHTNLHDSIAMMTDLSLYELTFTRFLESAWAACTQHKGVVDFFVGDRIFISFNASRACLRHQKRAANVATHLIGMHLIVTSPRFALCCTRKAFFLHHLFTPSPCFLFSEHCTLVYRLAMHTPHTTLRKPP